MVKSMEAYSLVKLFRLCVQRYPPLPALKKKYLHKRKNLTP